MSRVQRERAFYPVWVSIRLLYLPNTADQEMLRMEIAQKTVQYVVWIQYSVILAIT